MVCFFEDLSPLVLKHVLKHLLTHLLKYIKKLDQLNLNYFVFERFYGKLVNTEEPLLLFPMLVMNVLQIMVNIMYRME
jgi:hypothetical protein